MSTLTIVHPSIDFCKVIPSSKLLTSESLQISEINHTSIGDVTPAELLVLMNTVDEITFLKETYDYTSSLFYETLVALNATSHKKKIQNFDRQCIKSFLEINLEHIGHSHNANLWVFGCSHSHGVGLRQGQEKYSDILSATLGIELNSITKPGSSLSWSFRHLAAAPIHHNDIVVWQITTPGRISVYDGDIVETQLSQSKNPHLLETFTDQQIFFNHLTTIAAGVAYLRAMGVKFIMTSILNKSELFYQYLLEYTKYPEYCYSPGVFVDLGTDGLHVGPLSHKLLANAITNHYNTLYE